MAKGMGLIFLLFLTSLQLKSAFWHTVVCTMHTSWTYQCPPLCPIYLPDSAKCQFMIATA